MIVSFVIPALNEERHLPRCLRSVAELALPADVPEVEVVVVDNQSTDRTATIAKESGATVVSVPPGHVSRSRNRGAREGKGELVAFVDADCELSSDWLTRCLGHLRDPEVLAAGTGMAPPPPDAPWVERYWYDLAYGKPAGESERVDWLMSFNLLVRRSAFEGVGGFDEALVTCEDSDLGYKLAANGQLVKDHIARTVHHGESKTLRQFFRREAWRARGNLPMLFRQGLRLRELPSLLIPPLFVASAVAGVVLLLLGLAWPWLAWVGGGLLLAAASLPLLVLLRKRVSPARPWRFACCWVLVVVYFCARAVGLVMPVGRVRR